MADFTINSLSSGTPVNTDNFLKSDTSGALTKVSLEQIKNATIVNNQTTTQAGYALDARVGKMHGDAITGLQTITGNLTTIKNCTIVVASNVALTHQAGAAYAFKISDNAAIVYFSLRFGTSTARLVNSAVFHLQLDGHELALQEPYLFPCKVSTDTYLRFAGFSDESGVRFITTPVALTADSNIAFSGCSYATIL